MSNNCYVYFIKDNYAHIKIGISDNVKNRLRILQNAHAENLTILCVLKCDSEKVARELETKLHAYFNSYRLNGEWFKSKSILDFINQVDEEYELERKENYLYSELTSELAQILEEIGSDNLIEAMLYEELERKIADRKASDMLEAMFNHE